MIKARTLIGEDEENAKLGITIPKTMLRQLDTERGDVPRSTFILRLLEGRFNTKKG
jgi:hypothetical protein